MQIEGKTVLITGAGRGLGAAMARRFAELGAISRSSTSTPRVSTPSRERAGARPARRDLQRERCGRGRDQRRVRPRRGRLRAARLHDRERRHSARRPAREGQGRRGRRQAAARAMAGRDRRESHGRVPLRTRGRRADDPARQPGLHHQHLEPFARRQFRAEQLLRGEGGRIRAHGRLGERARSTTAFA